MNSEHPPDPKDFSGLRGSQLRFISGGGLTDAAMHISKSFGHTVVKLANGRELRLESAQRAEVEAGTLFILRPNDNGAGSTVQAALAPGTWLTLVNDAYFTLADLAAVPEPAS